MICVTSVSWTGEDRLNNEAFSFLFCFAFVSEDEVTVGHQGNCFGFIVPTDERFHQFNIVNCLIAH